MVSVSSQSAGLGLCGVVLGLGLRSPYPLDQLVVVDQLGVEAERHALGDMLAVLCGGGQR